jgi:hypothetical protein
MNNKIAKKQRKEQLKGYREAGQIYWTNDMEKAIRKIRNEKYSWMAAAIVEAVLLAACMIYHFYG